MSLIFFMYLVVICVINHEKYDVRSSFWSQLWVFGCSFEWANITIFMIMLDLSEFCIKYVHLDHMRWFMILDMLLDWKWILDEYEVKIMDYGYIEWCWGSPNGLVISTSDFRGNYVKKEDNKVGSKLWRGRKTGVCFGKHGQFVACQKSMDFGGELNQWFIFQIDFESP